MPYCTTLLTEINRVGLGTRTILHISISSSGLNWITTQFTYKLLRETHIMEKIGKEDFEYCSCGAGAIETGTHAVFGCIQGERWGRWWRTWKQMDQKWRWKEKITGENGREEEIDLIEEWCQKWWQREKA